MKIEKISGDVLKVTLNVSDMLKWNVSKDTLIPGNPNSNEMFWDIIHLASEVTGVKFEGCKLTVEAIEKDSDTFVIFITKRERSSAETKVKRYKYSKNKNKSDSSPSVMVYAFKEFNDICYFAKTNLYFCSLFDRNNSVYKYKNVYYLVVYVPTFLKEYAEKFGDAIVEYASLMENAYIYASFLEEHSSPIIEKNALKTLYDKL